MDSSYWDLQSFVLLNDEINMMVGTNSFAWVTLTTIESSQTDFEFQVNHFISVNYNQEQNVRSSPTAIWISEIIEIVDWSTIFIQWSGARSLADSIYLKYRAF